MSILSSQFEAGFEMVAARCPAADREHCRHLFFEGAHWVLSHVNLILNHVPPGDQPRALCRVIDCVMDFGETTAVERIGAAIGETTDG